MIDRKSVSKWKRQVRKLPETAERHIEDAMTKNGDEAVKFMKLLAPQPGQGRATGATRSSIFYYIRKIPTGIQLTIGAGDGEDAPARIVEFVNEQPFFYPTLRLQGKRYRGRYRRAINKAAKEIASRG